MGYQQIASRPLFPTASFSRRKSWPEHRASVPIIWPPARKVQSLWQSLRPSLCDRTMVTDEASIEDGIPMSTSLPMVAALSCVCSVEKTRKALYHAWVNLAAPANTEILKQILAKRNPLLCAAVYSHSLCLQIF